MLRLFIHSLVNTTQGSLNSSSESLLFCEITLVVLLEVLSVSDEQFVSNFKGTTGGL